MLGSSRIIALSLGCTLLLLAGQAQCLEAVRPIPGYVCMSLIPEDQLVTVQSELPPVLAAPSPTAALVGYPSAIVFVKWPLHANAILLWLSVATQRRLYRVQRRERRLLRFAIRRDRTTRPRRL